MNLKDRRPVMLLGDLENDRISRNVLIWLNTFLDIPVDAITYESLKADAESMALSTIPGTFITQEYITGDREAEYQFKVIYRLKPGRSMDMRLKADELLDHMGDWAVEPDVISTLDLGKGREPVNVEVASRSSEFGRYEDGWEDHQIIIRLTYLIKA